LSYVTKFSSSKMSTQSLEYQHFHATLEEEGVFKNVEGSCPTAIIRQCQQPLMEYTALTTPLSASIEHYCGERRRLGGKKEVFADLGRLLAGEEEEEADAIVESVVDPPIVLPAATAAVLYKTKTGDRRRLGGGPADAKYVLAFQGTKFSEPAMLMYSQKKEAVYVDMGGGYSTVTTEGFAMYTSEIFPCMDSMLSSLGKVPYITGHSLGGSAATLYAEKSGSYVELVTFGAMPTTPIDYKPASVKCELDWVGGKCKSGGYTPPSFQTPTLPNSFRYFHKFDPIPGYYFSLTTWKHVSETAYLLYDSTEECTFDPNLNGITYDSGYTLANYDSDFNGLTHAATAVVEDIYDMLCDEYGVSPGVWEVQGDPNVYFSYTNAMNPMPCAEALLTLTVDYVNSAPGMSVPFSSTNPAPGTWIMYESFYECSQSYIASLSAYFAIYLAGQLKDTYWPHFYDSDVTAAEVQWHLMFYGMWGLWWIHSSYPNYDLNTEYGPQNFAMITSAEDDYVSSSLETLEAIAGATIPDFALDAWWDGDYDDLEQKVKDYLDIEEWTEYVPKAEKGCEEPNKSCAGWLDYVTESLIPSGNCYYTWIYTTYVITERRGCAECTVAKAQDAFKAEPCKGSK